MLSTFVLGFMLFQDVIGDADLVKCDPMQTLDFAFDMCASEVKFALGSMAAAAPMNKLDVVTGPAGSKGVIAAEDIKIGCVQLVPLTNLVSKKQIAVKDIPACSSTAMHIGTFDFQAETYQVFLNPKTVLPNKDYNWIHHHHHHHSQPGPGGDGHDSEEEAEPDGSSVLVLQTIGRGEKSQLYFREP